MMRFWLSSNTFFRQFIFQSEQKHDQTIHVEMIVFSKENWVDQKCIWDTCEMTWNYLFHLRVCLLFCSTWTESVQTLVLD